MFLRILFLTYFGLVCFDVEAITLKQKDSIARKVFNNLYAAVGSSKKVPNFFVNGRKEHEVACYDVNGNIVSIQLEEKAFDICNSFADETLRDKALAFLIGHEIGHVESDHHWGTNFINSYAFNELENKVKLANQDSITTKELQADERGGIFCYMAGYDISGVADTLLPLIYEGYEIKESERYPSMEKRIELSNQRDQLIRKYAQVFKLGNFAMAVGHYEIAINCYNFIIAKNFHNREIYNNVGIANFYMAQKLSGKSYGKFLFPVEIDFSGELNRVSDKGSVDKIIMHLTEAYFMFETAMRYDRKALHTQLNMASCLTLLGQFGISIDRLDEVGYHPSKALLEKCLRLTSKNGSYENETLYGDAQLVFALNELLHPKGDHKRAAKTLKELVKKKHPFAEINQQRLEGKTEELSGYSNIAMFDKCVDNDTSKNTVVESLGNKGAYNRAMLDEMPFEEIVISNNIVYFFEQLESYYLVTLYGGNNLMMFHITKENSKEETSLSIGLNMTLCDVLKTYGTPDNIIPATVGKLYCYTTFNVTFLIDENETITEIMTYRVPLK